jgi:hypothetical protein
MKPGDRVDRCEIEKDSTFQDHAQERESRDTFRVCGLLHEFVAMTSLCCFLRLRRSDASASYDALFATRSTSLSIAARSCMSGLVPKSKRGRGSPRRRRRIRSGCSPSCTTSSWPSCPRTSSSTPATFRREKSCRGTYRGSGKLRARRSKRLQYPCSTLDRPRVHRLGSRRLYSNRY